MCWSAVVSQPVAAGSSPSPIVSLTSEESKNDASKTKKNRCFMCRKRVGLTGKKSQMTRGASDDNESMDMGTSGYFKIRSHFEVLTRYQQFYV